MKESQRSPSRDASHQANTNSKSASFAKKSNHDSNLAVKIRDLVSRRHYNEAANLLRTAPRSTWASNTLGVCLMRAGQVDEALKIYRALLLIPGTTQLRPDTDDLCRVNFATALMLHGLPSGALDVLSELRAPKLPAAVMIREAIQTWSRSLPLWRRIDWKLNRVDPPGARVPIDFEPGEFTFLSRQSWQRPPLGPLHPDLAA